MRIEVTLITAESRSCCTILTSILVCQCLTFIMVLVVVVIIVFQTRTIRSLSLIIKRYRVVIVMDQGNVLVTAKGRGLMVTSLRTGPYFFSSRARC